MAKKDNKLEWKIGSVIIVVILGLMTWGIISLFWMGGTEKIEAVANQFKPGKDWTLTQEQIEAPKSFCGDVKCPSVKRTWALPTYLTKQDFESLIKSAGWNLHFEKGCFEAQDIAQASCWARGSANGYNILLIANNDDTLTSKPSIHLTVEN